jgi:peptidoglycan/xylan/chitin deacetylase (PgdA/CDA1 family)
VPVRVALTFDTEHPGRPSPPGVTESILATLDREALRATFFLQGRWVRAYPGLARRVAEAGHAIGNHSHHHAPMDAFTDEWLRRDVREAEETIQAAAGVDPRPWFRCPFGSGMEDPRVLGLLDELGYVHVGWDVDPQDWEEGRTAEELSTSVLEGVAEHEEAIVLLHGWPGVTAEALPQLIDSLREAGAEFVDVPSLGQRTVPR